MVDQVCTPDLIEHQFGIAGTDSTAVENVKRAIRDLHGAVAEHRGVPDRFALLAQTGVLDLLAPAAVGGAR